MSFFRARHTKSRRFGLAGLFDKSIYVVALFAVVANLPQLLNIWLAKNTDGVSLISWAGFLIGSVFWLLYGILHKETPIIFINVLLILVQSGIVLGLLIN